MRIGLFTDTYLPQVSGVATSIMTLKTELEKMGHMVFIFTTTDRDIEGFDDWTIIRLPSVPFLSFKERRIAYGGFSDAIEIARRYQLDIIHTQTEFSLGFLGLEIGKRLDIPVVHTYHTKYEDYVRYIAKGMLVRPGMVKYYIKNFLRNKVDGVICPSEVAKGTLQAYKIKSQLRVIPTGIELSKFDRPEIDDAVMRDLRHKLGIADDETMLLSVSRISYEKNIQAIIEQFPIVLEKTDKIKLVIVGGGPYEEELRKQIEKRRLGHAIVMTGMVQPADVALYYKAADFFISASTSETQGLTYIEALACGTPILAHGNPYLEHVVDSPVYGQLFYRESEIPDAILKAQNRPKMSEEDLARKRLEVSAQTFGERVYQFYLDLQIAHRHNKTVQKIQLSDAASIRKLDEGATIIVGPSKSIPKHLSLKTVDRSKRVIKVSRKRLKTIRRLFSKKS